MAKFIFLILLWINCVYSLILSGGPYCTTNGDSNTQQHADPNSLVNINCFVNNTGAVLNALVWTIDRDNDGNTDITVANSDGSDASQSGFTSTVNNFMDDSTTNATLTFIAQMDLDGAVITCTDNVGRTNDCSLLIKTIPSPPNLRCTERTYNSLTLSWDPPNDNGGDDITYQVTLQTSSDESVTSYNDMYMTTFTVTNLQPLTQYTVNISANNSVGFSEINTTECTTLMSEIFPPVPVEMCFKINETDEYIIVIITSQPCPPLSPNVTTTPDFDNFTINITGYDSLTTTSCKREVEITNQADYTISVTVNNYVGASEPNITMINTIWIRDIQVNTTTKQLTYSLPDCIINDDNTAIVTLTITCDDTNDITLQQPYDNDYTIFDYSTVLSSNVTPNCNYIIQVIVPDDNDRVIATGTYNGPLKENIVILPPTSQVSPSPIISSTIATSTMPTSGTTPPVNPTSGSSDLPLPAIVGAVIGAIILILVIVIIVIIVIIIYKKYNSVKSDGVDFTSDKRGHGDPIPLVQKNMPETGQAALYQDPDTIKHKEAPTGDMYALPDKGSKRRPPPAGPELATYQDPDTIRREVAHTGDLYAQPDKKPMYTEVNMQTPGGMYMDHMTPASQLEQPPLFWKNLVNFESKKILSQ